MTHDRFVQLVRRLESLAQRHPRAYRIRLGLLAALGYGYALLLLAVALGLLTVLVWSAVSARRIHAGWVKPGIALAVFAWIVARSLWVKIPRPEGVPLVRARSPGLFALVDELCDVLSVRRPDHVLMDGDFNASVMQIPRLGALGWERSYLVLGLPFMFAVSPEQFRAVLAHELGHLSENHGRLAVWIGRVRETWGRMMQQFEEGGHWGGFLLTWFSRWYGPYFMAYSFVLAREHEKAADRFAAELTSSAAAATALAAIDVRNRFLDEEFWPHIYNQVSDRDTPPEGVYGQLREAVRRPIESGRAERWLMDALGPDTDFDDTHPSLRDRLAARGYAGAREKEETRRALVPGELAVSAADRFLGADLVEYAAALDSMWIDAIGPTWEGRHRETQQAARRLGELSSKAATDSLSREEAWQRTQLTADFGRPEDAVPMLRDMVERWPDFEPARFALGSSLLDQDDESGMRFIEDAMTADIDFELPGSEAIYAFLKRKGRNEEAAAHRKRAADRYDEIEAAQQKERTFTKRDIFLPHDLPDLVVEPIVGSLRAEPQVKEAYLARRELPDQDGKTQLVLGIAPHFRGLILDADSASQKLLERIFERYEPPVVMMVIVLHGRHAFLRKRMAQVEGAAIYRKGR